MSAVSTAYPSIAGRTVMVTGGSRGLGREMVLALAGAGAAVAVVGSRPGATLDDTVADANRLGAGKAVAIAADVADYAQCEAAATAALDAIGPIDVLINNAGLGMRRVSETFNTKPTRFWETEPEAWKDIIDTNINGVFNMARALVPGMVSRGFGKVINISTSDQTMIRQGYSPYGPSKAALEAMSRVWAQDLEGTGVDVNVYLPGGAADTDLLPPSANKKGADGNLLPADVMRRAVLWLVDDQSNGVTGGRYIARLWDDSLSPNEAAGASRVPSVLKPAIM